MWTVIKKNNINAFLSEYPELEEDFDIFKLYESKNNIILPRYFSKNYPSKFLDANGYFTDSSEIKMKFNLKKYPLRPDQQNIINTILPLYNSQKYINGVIKARPGMGKTGTAIYLASLIGKKSLFLVDNDNLMKQWIKEIIKFTNLKPENIGIIKQSFLGIKEPVCVGMVQTLLSKFKNDTKTIFEKMDEANYGFISFDEVHKTSSSEKYSKVSTLFRAPNIIGLSATPYKYGAQDILMKNVIGDIIYESKEYELKPSINFVFYESKLTKYRWILSKMGDYTKKKSYYNSIVYKSPSYLNIVRKYVKQSLDDNHRVIVICWTKNQVTSISDSLNEIGIKNRKFYGDEREYKTTDKVLVSTYAFASHGFDYKELSSIVLACPLSGKVSVIQCIGRILRECEGKVAPVVYDLVDISFPTMFLPDLKRKKDLLENEFSPVVNEIKEYDK